MDANVDTTKRCWLLQTAGRWPWKSEPAKECVTTHLPKQLALKMVWRSSVLPMLGRRGIAGARASRSPGE